MDYTAYHFTVTPPQPGSEILMALISDFGFESFDSNKTGFSAYIQEAFIDKVDLEEFKFDDFSFTYQIEKIPLVNWNSEWEKNFEPVLVENLLCIRAPFHPKNTLVKHEIVIMPKMSFGTGHHQTTRLMCRQMFETNFKNKKVLDMGCGTGILAILAKMLGAKEATGIDIDAWSVENAVENCASNGFPEISIKKGDLAELMNESPFDIILANINKNILKAQIPVYAQKLNENGILFLSGFFTTDLDELKVTSEQNGFSFFSSKNEAEWAMMILSKN